MCRPRFLVPPCASLESRASKKSPHLLGLESQLAAAVAGRMPAGRSRCRAHPARLASPPPRRRAARAPSQRLPSPGWRRERPREGSPRAGARDAGTTKVLATAPRPSHHMRRLPVDGRGPELDETATPTLTALFRPIWILASRRDFRPPTRRYRPDSHYSPLHPVGPDLACSVAAMNRRPHRPRSPFQLRTGFLRPSRLPISAVYDASRLPSCRK